MEGEGAHEWVSEEINVWDILESVTLFLFISIFFIKNTKCLYLCTKLFCESMGNGESISFIILLFLYFMVIIFF